MSEIAAEIIGTWGAGVGPVPGEGGDVVPPDGLPPTLIRHYVGSRRRRARRRSIDAPALADRGYFPVKESYVPDQWSGGEWLGALLLFLFLIGIFIVLYMVAAKPDRGTLAVTYQRAPDVVALVPDQRSVRERLAAIDRLHGDGVISEEERAQKRADAMRDL